MKRLMAGPVIVFILLFIIPFFWLQSGTLDLGGDGSRLYFLDATAYLRNYSLYGISPSNIGGENIGYSTVPFITLLALFQNIGISKTFIINALHGMAVGFTFLFTYLALREIGALVQLQRHHVQLAAFVGSLLYALSPNSTAGWDKVLLIHDKVFLNPLILYLLMKYVVTGTFLYPVIALIITYIFSINFSYAAAPGLVSYYPILIVFLITLTRHVIKKPIRVIHIIIGLGIFFCLHSFHLVPQLQSIFSPNSVAHSAIFSTVGKFDRGLNYFNGIVNEIKVSNNFMLIPQMAEMHIEYYILILLPLTIVGGLVVVSTQTQLVKRTYVLAISVFLFLFFFATANVTDIGVRFYRSLFSLPGFSMFRNYHGQWISAYLLFYTIVFFLGLAVVIPKIKRKTLGISISLFIILLGVSSYSFVKGDVMNPYLWQSKKVRIAMDPSPDFLEALQGVRSLTTDGRVLTLPLTDPSYQIIAGKTTGAYQGPSVISYLSGRQDFSGIAEFGIYQPQIVKYVQEKDYESFKKLIGLLGVRYIFYNSDPRVYDAFPKFPYDYVRTFMPSTHNEYGLFLEAMKLHKLWSIGTYHLYELDPTLVVPEVFVTNSVISLHGKDLNPSVITGQQNTRDNTIITEAVHTSEAETSDVYALEPRSSILAMLKNPEKPANLHFSFARISPLSWIYPAVLVKEQRILLRIPHSDTISFIDWRLFLSAKRMYELEKWGNEIVMHGDVETMDDLSAYYSNPPRISEFWNIPAFFMKQFDSWEYLLSWYKHAMLEAIIAAQTLDRQSIDFWRQTYLINQYLMRDHGRLISLVRGSTWNESEQKYLLNIVDTLFDALQSDLAMPMLDTFRIDYASLPESVTNDSYFAELLPEEIASFPIDGMSLSATDSFVYSFTREGETIRTIPFQPHTGQTYSLSLVPNDNALLRSDVISLSQGVSHGVATIDSKLTFLSGQAGNVFKVDTWIPGAYYLISFEYFTDTMPFQVRVSEGASSNISNSQELLINDFLSSKRWLPYQAVVRAGLHADEAYVQFTQDSQSKELGVLSLKNMSLIHLPQPSLMLQRNTQFPSQPALRAYTNKISPTRYEVKVQGAVAPYYLVLNQSFDSGWSVYPTSDNQYTFMDWYGSYDSLPTVAQRIWYEAIHTPDGNPIDDSMHRRVNGYANGWLIQPDNVGKKSEQTFVIVFGTQRYFIITMIVSFMTVVGLIIYVIVYAYTKKIST